MDCLVTKLKGAVSDSSLKKLGEMRLTIHKDGKSASKRYIAINPGFNECILTLSDGYFTDSSGVENKGSQITLSQNTYNTLYISTTNDAILSISNKYCFVNFALSGNNTISMDSFDDINYCKNNSVLTISRVMLNDDLSNLKLPDVLTTIQLTYLDITGNVDNLAKHTNFVSLSLMECPNITGSISAFQDMVNLETLSVNQTKLAGDLTMLQKLTKLKTLNLTGCPNITGDIAEIKSPVESLNIANTPLTGTIESFVATQRSAGRTTGSLSNGDLGWPKGITFQSESVANETGTLSWTPTQITWNEETITA